MTVWRGWRGWRGGGGGVSVCVMLTCSWGGSAYCGRCRPGSRAPPRRPPRTGPGGEAARRDTPGTAMPRSPNRRRRSCGRLRREGGGQNIKALLSPSPPQTQQSGPTSAPAVAVLVMPGRTLGNTLPTMQGGARQTAQAVGVVRETGGTGRVAGCEMEADVTARGSGGVVVPLLFPLRLRKNSDAWDGGGEESPSSTPIRCVLPPSTPPTKELNPPSHSSEIEPIHIHRASECSLVRERHQLAA